MIKTSVHVVSLLCIVLRSLVCVYLCLHVWPLQLFSLDSVMEGNFGRQDTEGQQDIQRVGDRDVTVHWGKDDNEEGGY